MGLAVTQPPLLLLRSNQLGDPVPVIIHAHPHHLVLVDHVGHVAVDEVGVEGRMVLVLHEHLLLLRNDTHLLIVIQDEEVSPLFERAELEVEFPLELGIPG
jgi:hypothetical protein